MNPAEYLSQARFHRSVRYEDGKGRISFAFVGAWPDDAVNRYDVEGMELQRAIIDWQSKRTRPVLLYILPSGCSRYIGILLSAIAREKGVSVLAIDRPGAGATPSCDLHERINIATEHSLYVLRHLGIRRVDILTHSVGWLYALELLTRAPALMGDGGDDADATTRPRLVFSSPFVPTKQSGSALGWLPEGLISLEPHAFYVFSSFDKALTWSAGFVPSSWSVASPSEADDEKQRESNRRKKPLAKFHPPYRPHCAKGNGLEAWKEVAKRTHKSPLHPGTGRKLASGEKLLLEYFAEEGGVKAATQDFLICLGKAQGMNSSQMITWIEQKLTELSVEIDSKKKKPDITIIWAEKDGLIPLQGRRYLNERFEHLIEKNPDISFEQWVMADAGHDAGLASSEVMNAVFDKFQRP